MSLELYGSKTNVGYNMERRLATQEEVQDFVGKYLSIAIKITGTDRLSVSTDGLFICAHLAPGEPKGSTEIKMYMGGDNPIIYAPVEYVYDESGLYLEN
jgi:hypothetical protein